MLVRDPDDDEVGRRLRAEGVERDRLRVEVHLHSCVRSSSRRRRVARSGKSSRATSATIAPVGTWAVDTTACVRSGSRRAMLAGATAVSRSNTRNASARPSSSRAAPSMASCADAQVRHDRSTLLRHPRLVDARDLEPVEVGGGGQHLADGDHAGPADAGDEQRRARRAARVQGATAGRCRAPGGPGRGSGAASPSRTRGSRPRCSSCRGCTSPGGSASCARTACRPGARSGSSRRRRSGRNPRTRPR